MDQRKDYLIPDSTILGEVAMKHIGGCLSDGSIILTDAGASAAQVELP